MVNPFYGKRTIAQPAPSIEVIGNDTIMLSGKLSQDTGITVNLLDWLYFDTVSNGWKIVLDTTDLSDKLVKFVSRIYDKNSDADIESVSVDTEPHNRFVFSCSKECLFKASDTYIRSGTDRVAFDPLVHTGLAGKLDILIRQIDEVSPDVVYFQYK